MYIISKFFVLKNLQIKIASIATFIVKTVCRNIEIYSGKIKSTVTFISQLAGDTG